MSHATSLPLLALGLTFTACDDPVDPIVGQWRLEETLEISEGVNFSREIDVSIDEDMTGKVLIVAHYDAPGTEYDADYDYALDLEVTKLPGGNYSVLATPHPEDDDGTLDCTVTEDILHCSDGKGVTDWTLERQD